MMNVFNVIILLLLLVLIGMKDGQQIRFSSEGDQEPGIEPGDIIVVLDEQKHGVFKRRGHDLFIDFEIDLVDALCGFQKTVETLDKRTLLVTSLPGILFFFSELYINFSGIECVYYSKFLFRGIFLGALKLQFGQIPGKTTFEGIRAGFCGVYGFLLPSKREMFCNLLNKSICLWLFLLETIDMEKGKGRCEKKMTSECK